MDSAYYKQFARKNLQNADGRPLTADDQLADKLIRRLAPMSKRAHIWNAVFDLSNCAGSSPRFFLESSRSPSSHN